MLMPLRQGCCLHKGRPLQAMHGGNATTHLFVHKTVLDASPLHTLCVQETEQLEEELPRFPAVAQPPGLVALKLGDDVGYDGAVLDGLLNVAAALVEGKAVVAFVQAHALNQCVHHLGCGRGAGGGREGGGRGAGGVREGCGRGAGGVREGCGRGAGGVREGCGRGAGGVREGCGRGEGKRGTLKLWWNIIIISVTIKFIFAEAIVYTGQKYKRPM